MMRVAMAETRETRVRIPAMVEVRHEIAAIPATLPERRDGEPEGRK